MLHLLILLMFYKGKLELILLILVRIFLIGDVYETSNSTEVEGTKTNLVEAITGTGQGAVESAMEALRDAVAGKQYDIYEADDILTDDDGNAITWDDGTTGSGDTISFTISIGGVNRTVTTTAGSAAIPGPTCLYRLLL